MARVGPTRDQAGRLEAAEGDVHGLGCDEALAGQLGIGQAGRRLEQSIVSIVLPLFRAADDKLR